MSSPGPASSDVSSLQSSAAGLRWSIMADGASARARVTELRDWRTYVRQSRMFGAAAVAAGTVVGLGAAACLRQRRHPRQGNREPTPAAQRSTTGLVAAAVASSLWRAVAPIILAKVSAQLAGFVGACGSSDHQDRDNARNGFPFDADDYEDAVEGRP